MKLFINAVMCFSLHCFLLPVGASVSAVETHRAVTKIVVPRPTAVYQCIKSNRFQVFLSDVSPKLYKRCSIGEVWRLDDRGCLFNIYKGQYLTDNLNFSPTCSQGEKWRISSQGNTSCIQNIHNQADGRPSYIYDGGRNSNASFAHECRAGEQWRFAGVSSDILETMHSATCRSQLAGNYVTARQMRSQLSASFHQVQLAVHAHNEQLNGLIRESEALWGDEHSDILKQRFDDVKKRNVAAQNAQTSFSRNFVATKNRLEELTANLPGKVNKRRCLLAIDQARLELEYLSAQLMALDPFLHTVQSDVFAINSRLVKLAKMISRISLTLRVRRSFDELHKTASELNQHVSDLSERMP